MVAFSANKRALFRKLSTNADDVIRPPWSVDEYLFVEICRNCNACQDACPESIIQFDSRNQPFVNFHQGECSFCADCVSVCENAALLKVNEDALPWTAKVVLKMVVCQNKTHCAGVVAMYVTMMLYISLSV